MADNGHRLYESKYNDILGKYNSAISDGKKANADLKDLEKEHDKLKKQLDALRKNLEEETLARVDLENNIQSLKEELTFKDQVFQQELSESRTRRQVEISEIDGRLTEQYEAKLQQSLQELRDQYEGQMRGNREEIEGIFIGFSYMRLANIAITFQVFTKTRSKVYKTKLLVLVTPQTLFMKSSVYLVPAQKDSTVRSTNWRPHRLHFQLAFATWRQCWIQSVLVSIAICSMLKLNWFVCAKKWRSRCLNIKI